MNMILMRGLVAVSLPYGLCNVVSVSSPLLVAVLHLRVGVGAAAGIVIIPSGQSGLCGVVC